MKEIKKLSIQIDGEVYETNSTVAYNQKQKWTQPDERFIKSIIPGTIVDVLVKEGQNVKDGDIMIIIEAMKMNNRLALNHSGVVDKILISKGDVVSRGQDLIVLK